MAKRKYTSKKSKQKSSSIGAKFIKYFSLIIVLIFVLGYLSFRAWNSKQRSNIEMISNIVNTSMGSIEYSSMGKGPIILLSHMEGSGADNIQLFGDLIDAGYQVICPSRPGYLNTPTHEASSFKYTSEMYAELLQHLDIKQKVIVIGLSVGGPAAIEFTKKYSDKTSALILINAATKAVDSNSNLSQLFNLKNIPFLNDESDIVSWIDFNFAKYGTKEIIYSIIENASVTSPETKLDRVNELLNKPNTKDNLLNYLKLTSPRSNRIAGFENDIQNLSNYQSGKIRSRIPKLVIHSKINGVIDFEHAAQFEKNNSNTDVFSYNGDGHAFWLGEDLKQINSKIISFLNNKTKNKNVDEVIIPTKLSGVTWVNKSDGALLQIKEDGSFSLDFPSVDRKKYYEGKFSVVEDQISFTYASTVESCASITGVYQLKITADQLELKTLNDKCKVRKQHFSQGWFKVD